MMNYDPFSRGSLPAGVRTVRFATSDDLHAVTAAEVWYPAAPAYQGWDLTELGRDRYPIAAGLDGSQAAVRNAQAAPVSGLPLLVYCHGGYGHRRDNAALITHLVSHGYVVVAPQVLDSVADMGLTGGEATIKDEPSDRSAAMRPRQAAWTVTQILERAVPEIAHQVDRTRIGSFGGSLGGYTALEMNAVDRRISASVALAPACGHRSPIPGMERIDALMHPAAWRNVPMTIVAGDADGLVMLDDVRDLFERVPGPKRLVVLKNAGHFHMFDNAEAGHELYRKAYTSGQFPDPEIDAPAIGRAMRPFAAMLSEARSAEAKCAITLAHMDAHLKGRTEAAAFLDVGLTVLLERRGITHDVVAGVGA